MMLHIHNIFCHIVNGCKHNYIIFSYKFICAYITSVSTVICNLLVFISRLVQWSFFWVQATKPHDFANALAPRHHVSEGSIFWVRTLNGKMVTKQRSTIVDDIYLLINWISTINQLLNRMKHQALWVPRPHALSHSRQLGQCQEQYACWEREAAGSCSFSVQWCPSKAVYGHGSMYCLLTSFQVYYTYKCREIDIYNDIYNDIYI